ncbi:hypothetical protein [Pygmaiobacter massiliensis]|uniref:hypothetical protein n=1 Tax=Pygmaiobacter massiliensis TaxID=1917873 RepID=UPI000C7D0D66|nr:hypothetical protein [Pygmaiobacter massiliensis]
MKPVICPHCNAQVPISFRGRWPVYAECPQCSRLLIEKNKQIARILFWILTLVPYIFQSRLASVASTYYDFSVGEKILFFLLRAGIYIICLYAIDLIIYYFFRDNFHLHRMQ